MRDGRSGVRALTRFACDRFASRGAAQVDDVDVLARLGARASRRLGGFQQFAVAAADPRVALSNAFGFGGTDACLVFSRWEA